MAVPTEIHHTVPRCLLRLRDRADAASLGGEGMSSGWSSSTRLPATAWIHTCAARISLPS
jgi:hypothetical protein